MRTENKKKRLALYEAVSEWWSTDYHYQNGNLCLYTAHIHILVCWWFFCSYSDINILYKFHITEPNVCVYVYMLFTTLMSIALLYSAFYKNEKHPTKAGICVEHQWLNMLMMFNFGFIMSVIHINGCIGWLPLLAWLHATMNRILW